MEQIIIIERSADALNARIRLMIGEGWKPVGSHNVVTTHEQLRYSGMQHKDTVYTREYSQTMVKKVKSHDANESFEDDIKIPAFDTSRPLGSFTDDELFKVGEIARLHLSQNKSLKENVLYKIGYDFNGPTTAIARYVAETDTLYYISLREDGGVGMETPAKIKNLQIIDIIYNF